MATDLGLLKGAVTDVLDLTGQATKDTANARAQSITAAGDREEAAAYGTAAGIADQNAMLEGVAGDIQGIQEQRKATQAIGRQRAGIGAAGFTGSSGTAVALLQESLRQQYIGQQIIQTQTQITQGGSLAQGAASRAEQATANAAANAADELGAGYTAAAGTATANAARETAAIDALLRDQSTNNTLTPEQKRTQDLVTATLKGGDAALPDETGGKPLPGAGKWGGLGGMWKGGFG